ncbi:MAG: L-threonylcarbamoyladenylate synthase [Phycisphaerales bacterium]|nr:threonylcarbamoyl-AMP synthase [Phycisphaeraceae bacterium]
MNADDQSDPEHRPGHSPQAGGGQDRGDIAALHAAARRLREGGIVAFPTETVYGLGADALSADAVRRVFALKGRPSNNPLIVHVSGPDMAQRVVSRWTPKADALARAFWPGPLTMVLPKDPAVPDEVTGGPGSKTVAVRAPNHPIATALLMLFGGPLVGPSANRSGHVSPTSVDHVRETFSPRDVLAIDGGECGVGIESTVLLVPVIPGMRARILRPGIIGADEIARVLGEPVDDVAPAQPPIGGDPRHAEPTRPGTAAIAQGAAEEANEAAPSDRPMLSPGTMASHYAPRTRTVMVDEVEGCDALEDLIDAGTGRAVILTHRIVTHVPPPHELVRLPARAMEYAQAIYSAMRQADRASADVIIIERPPTQSEMPGETAVWRAIADRLARATAPR